MSQAGRVVYVRRRVHLTGISVNVEAEVDLVTGAVVVLSVEDASTGTTGELTWFSDDDRRIIDDSARAFARHHHGASTP